MGSKGLNRTVQPNKSYTDTHTHTHTHTHSHTRARFDDTGLEKQTRNKEANCATSCTLGLSYKNNDNDDACM